MKSLSWMALLLVTVSFGITTIAASSPSSAATPTPQKESNFWQVPRIGIISPMAMEQAPILAAMKVQDTIRKDGYIFYVGTIAGQPVVDVRSGEKEYAAELAMTLMALTFHLKGALLAGTAGARNPSIHVGDVVVSGFVVDKSSLHYHNHGDATPYTGLEMLTTPHSLDSHAIVGGYGIVGPNPQNAANFGYGSSHLSTEYVYFEALSGSQALATLALSSQAVLGTTPVSDITGNPKQSGSQPAKVIEGVIGSANQWTEPLSWMAAQNALYPSDAGENEGMGFAYVTTQMGIPWLIVRGISDSPWYPSTYHGVLAADRAAKIVESVIAHWPKSSVLRNTATFSNLSPESNAKKWGYIVGNKAFYQVGPVTQIVYTNSHGQTVTINSPNESEYIMP
ncbi:5'-methylthioadenosine/S-adenosylhomocysteine nucleosidase [Sulfobacillus thermosulfidooxidans]|uniref:5'-methylthioadenosine/S-adenosylhomocysteine nucleosidase family protein n=1 Tax=Sulfobacillus thermosulfidooxidans TaxID=28034 RepID=UPI0006B4FEE5|nr:5'-methylthioadenosine/S-adenosylhomocysteine nucleosidase [Sulfobacillus thermosulfidooxidans]